MRPDPLPPTTGAPRTQVAAVVGPSSHRDLLEVATGLQRAALEADLVSVHQQLRHLRLVLVDHIRSEEPDLSVLPPTTRAVVARGQEDLVRLLDQLLSTTASADDGCGCMIRAADVQRALIRQAHLENGALGARSRA